MATILSLSSQVVSGYVGASASTFTLQRLGHTVLSIPTILLSNHPGHKKFTGSATDPNLISNIINTLHENGEFQKLDAAISGYQPTAAHARLAAELLARIRSANPDATLVCDPILGDEPKGLYIPNEAADIIKSGVLPLADLITPNRFELQWLSDTKTNSQNELIDAARSLPPAKTLLTSAPTESKKQLGNILITQDTSHICKVPLRQHAPNGTGDFLTALFLGYSLNKSDQEEALEKATRGVDAVIENSAGLNELRLVETQHIWSV